MDEKVPLLNAVDIEILMHRDAHFGGSFPIMINYYERDSVGVMPDFSVERLKALEALEKDGGKNLALDLIPPAEAEKVERAQKIYLDLRGVYGKQKPTDISTLISDLILSEEEHPKGEIAALVRKGELALGPLIDLIRSATFYDPLFPGYGRAPIFAADCLAKIGHEKAIAPLFEALGQENFFTDDAMISALGKFGNKARDFLLKILIKKPYNKDNEHAAIALTAMEDDPLVAKACLGILHKDNPFFSQYLIFGCSGLETADDRELFKSLTKSDQYPNYIKEEMLVIIKNWQ